MPSWKAADLVDLHAHSTASDGTETPAGLVERAAEAGVSVLALTDHDTLEGLDAFRTAARERKLTAVGGAEVSSTLDGRRLHVVALGIREGAGLPLLDLLDRMRRYRRERNQEMLSRLASIGCPLSLAEVESFAGGEVVARPHFARAMVARGYVESVAAAFPRYLAEGAPGYVPKKKVALEEIVGAIHACRSLAVAAHPNTLVPDDASKLEQRLRIAAEAGMDGVEAFHPDVSQGLRLRVFECARKLGLLVSAGSDFHGRNKPDVMLARGPRRRRLTAADVAPLLDRLAALGALG